MEIVNGYPCENCAEVALAKRGLDPAEAQGQLKTDADVARELAAATAEPKRAEVSGAGGRVDVFA
jgi:hypothetical protein